MTDKENHNHHDQSGDAEQEFAQTASTETNSDKTEHSNKSERSQEQNVIPASHVEPEQEPSKGKKAAPLSLNPPLAGIHQNPAPQLTVEQQLAKLKRDLESMVIRYAKSESENLINKSKSEELDKKLKRAIKDNDSLANRIKILTNDKAHLTDTLNAKMAQLTVLEQKNSTLTNVQSGKLKELEVEVQQLRQTNEDLLKQIEAFRCKEGELMDFSERLSMKQMLLETELDKALGCAPDYKAQYEQLVKENGELNRRVGELTDLHKSTLESSVNEGELNKKLREELDLLGQKYKRGIEELENEMKVMKRKHQMAMKELLKQMKSKGQ